MRVLWSKSTNGFYEAGNSNPPSDCVEITDEVRKQLIAEQATGLEIFTGEDGLPSTRVRVYSEEESAMTIRTIRDRLLSSSDHTQLDDSPRDRVAWKLYRNDLRDIPNQVDFPNNIIWPTEPT